MFLGRTDVTMSPLSPVLTMFAFPSSHRKYSLIDSENDLDSSVLTALPLAPNNFELKMYMVLSTQLQLSHCSLSVSGLLNRAYLLNETGKLILVTS